VQADDSIHPDPSTIKPLLGQPSESLPLVVPENASLERHGCILTGSAIAANMKMCSLEVWMAWLGLVVKLRQIFNNNCWKICR
jgi:hypothetical protein